MAKIQNDTEILKWFREHDRKDRIDYERINESIEQMRDEVKEVKAQIKDLREQVKPMVDQDEHVKWAAQKVTKWLKITGVIIALLASAIAAYKGIIK